MPDVASNRETSDLCHLDWVGMGNIQMPIRLHSDNATSQSVLANIQAYVNLNEQSSKGIHMSRLYILLDELTLHEGLSIHSLDKLLHDFLESHTHLSNKACLEFNFTYSERRPSLKSKNLGWKNYPIKIKGIIEDSHVNIELTLSVAYSSTCPCSAALARQLIQDAFIKRFDNEDINMNTVLDWLGSTDGICATPHSQRSIVETSIQLSRQQSTFPLSQLINDIENTLKTPVQATVKREDEQEFTILNGQNLMFVEDAARKLRGMLEKSNYIDYKLQIKHMESLHAHDAVATVVKGIENGYRP